MSRQPGALQRYLSLVKFSHTVFALPFAMLGLTLGVAESGHGLDVSLLLKVLLCMVFTRNAAMAFNRWLDRRFDALNPRTAVREIPAGLVSPRSALLFTIINAVLFVITTWFINTACFYLSFIALFVVLFYSYTKRFTPLCHLVLGLGLALAPIGAYLAVTGHFALLPVLFAIVVFTWVSGFDIIYALQDDDFDRSQNLHSIPVALGRRRALMVSNLLHVISGSLVFYAGWAGGFNWLYWTGAVVFSGLLLYQHLIISPTDLRRVGAAFATTNGAASILFATFAILSLTLS